MPSYKSKGGYHCGNEKFEMEFSKEPSSYSPRACDSNFFINHGASYVLDRNGKLVIFVKNGTNLSKYKQRSRISNFLVCRKCGVLVGVYYKNQEQLYATINSKAVNRNTTFGQETVVSPKDLSDNEKVQRWQDMWFSNAIIKYKNS